MFVKYVTINIKCSTVLQFHGWLMINHNSISMTIKKCQNSSIMSQK